MLGVRFVCVSVLISIVVHHNLTKTHAQIDSKHQRKHIFDFNFLIFCSFNNNTFIVMFEGGE